MKMNSPIVYSNRKYRASANLVSFYIFICVCGLKQRWRIESQFLALKALLRPCPSLALLHTLIVFAWLAWPLPSLAWLPQSECIPWGFHLLKQCQELCFYKIVFLATAYGCSIEMAKHTVSVYECYNTAFIICGEERIQIWQMWKVVCNVGDVFHAV